MKLLVTWIGITDLRASRGEDVGLGPIAQAVDDGSYEGVVLLNNLGEADAQAFNAWLRNRTSAIMRVVDKPLPSPTAYREIFLAARDVLDMIVEELGREATITLHLSPGTPAMASVWMILAQMGYRCTLIDSSPQRGVREVELPFDLAAEFIPARSSAIDAELTTLGTGETPRSPAFEDIAYRSDAMRRVVVKAEKIAARAVPVLIEGESGTGKELMARAIHKASPRADKPFVAVNCGAIVAELTESEFFGHRKGAFTGAVADRNGHFRAADGGTLFLDEIGELPLSMQVKLLRTLQESAVVPVGESKPIHVDVRIIAATNRNLVTEVSEGRFREDLFYRLALGVLKLPALRDRAGDVSVLVDRLTETINTALAREAAWKDKKISPKARKLVSEHTWPGNVRELQNTLTRAFVWADGTSVSEKEMRAAIMDGPRSSGRAIDFLNQPVENGVDIQSLMKSVATAYIPKALEAAKGNKTRAAKLLGLGSYQTLTNWMTKYDITE